MFAAQFVAEGGSVRVTLLHLIRQTIGGTNGVIIYTIRLPYSTESQLLLYFATFHDILQSSFFGGESWKESS